MNVLTPFSELPPETRSNLLLGNGFSQRIHGGFKYSSLLEVAKERGIIGADGVAIFREFGTDDFEHVLAQLWTCSRVSKLLGLDARPFDEKYHLVRTGLAQVVKAVHPRPEQLDRDSLAAFSMKLKETFRAVYTTNYDLLLYWVAAAAGFVPFGDFFWNQGLKFNPLECEERPSQLPILYLHGALFLSSDENGTEKLRGEWGQNLLERIDLRWGDGKVPLFVSEGTYEQKIRAIHSNPYLSFALSRFARLEDGLTVFGAVLWDKDRHLVDALLRNQRLKCLAVSVHGQSQETRRSKAEAARTHLNKLEDRGVSIFVFDADEFAASLPLPRVNAIATPDTTTTAG